MNLQHKFPITLKQEVERTHNSDIDVSTKTEWFCTGVPILYKTQVQITVSTCFI